jgi:hypothetical protein
MGAPTDRVPSSKIVYDDTSVKYPLKATAQTYYPGEMIGVDVTGYATKCDDTQKLIFLGLMGESPRVKIDAGGNDGDSLLTVDQPRLFTMTIAAAVIQDIGKPVFAKFSNEVSYAPGTFANLVGAVAGVRTATEVEIVPPWLAAQLFRKGSFTPAALAADANDYGPSGSEFAETLRVDPNGGGANRNITGFANGWHGRRLLVQNISAVAANNLTLVHASGASAAANRISGANLASVVIRPGGSCLLEYDGTSSLWRTVAV